MKKVNALILLMVMMAMALAGCVGQPAGQSAAPTDDFKVGFVYIGNPSDGGWSYAHDEARKEMIQNMGWTEDNTVIFTDVPEDQSCATAIDSLVKAGCNLIFTTSFGYMDYTEEAANKYPDVTFMHATGNKTAVNMGNYFGRAYQARYLTGMAAGKATQTNQIGYVAAFPIPEVIRGINAFTLGVRSVNPDAVVKVVWTKTWYDPTVEKEAAQSLLDSGVDVMAQHQDTYEPVAAAEKAGAFSTSYHASMAEHAPNGYLTGPVWTFGQFYTEVAKAVKEGTWEAKAYWPGIAEGAVKLDDFGPSVTDETKAQIKEKQDAIVSGSWDVFMGPIKDQSGTVRVAEGQKMTDDELLSFMWFVEGVEGSVE